jgi:pimeloyl-ACP methyl ester carboxylesterase
MADLGGKWIRRTDGDTCVIFIHGILSDGEQAWMNGNGNSWPQLLADEISLSDVGIYSFSYRSDLFCRTYSLKDVVDSFRETFSDDDLWSKRRIIFVCHSMGGIAARRFIVTNQARFIKGNTEIGLFLVASPSLGSRDANALFFIARLGENSQAAALRFAQSNIWLNDLHDEFRTLKESGNIRIKGKELVEDEAITIKKLFGFKTQIVEPWSAATYFGESYKIPHSNHSSIAKPKDAQEPQHRALVRFIREMRAVPITPIEPAPNFPISADERADTKRALDALDRRVSSGTALPREALLGFNEALIETRRYMGQQNGGAPRNLQIEQKLSDLWLEAAQLLWSNDRELAKLCMVKGNGWSDETVWDDPRYKDLPIKLNDMLARVMAAGDNEAQDVVDGECDIDTVTWRRRVLFRPAFKAAPQITLSRPDGKSSGEPSIESVTPDQFTIRISNNQQAGKWAWRARGTLLRNSG